MIDKRPEDFEKWVEPNDQPSPLDPEEYARFSEAVRYLEQVRSNIDQMRSDTPAALEATVNDEQSFTINSDEEVLPEYFGRYKIIRVVGQGGFARVFLATDPKLERDVALKVPKPTMIASAESRVRFRREAKAAAILSHPNIVPVFESDCLGPVDYIAAEFVDGTTLNQWLADQPKPLDQDTAAEIVATLADAVAHAHQRGVTHRDLKPGNVLIARRGDPSLDENLTTRLRITDFGLAKMDTSDQFRTVEGAILGTPAYMSPEQARGDAEISKSTDIYSLGVMLFELLTGRLPHVGLTHMETLQKVLTSTPPSPRSIRPSISRDLEAICLKALEPNVDRRYRSAYDLAGDLQNALAGLPIAARRINWFNRLCKWTRRHPSIAAGLLAVIASLSLGLSLTWWQYQQSQSNLATSQTQTKRAVSHLDQLVSTVDFILAEFGPKIEAGQQLSDVEFRVLNRLLTVHQSLIEREPGRVVVDAKLTDNYLRLSKILDLLGEYRQSAAYLDTAVELLNSVDATHPEFATLNRKRRTAVFEAFLLAFKHGSNEEIDTRLEAMKQALLTMKENTDRLESLRREHTYYRHLGLFERRKQNYEASESAFLTAYEKINSLTKAEPDNAHWQSAQLRSILDIAESTWASKRRQEAIKYYLQLIDTFLALPESQQQAPDNLFLLADCRSELGHALSRRGQYDEAREQFELGLVNYRQLRRLQPELSQGRQAHLLVRLANLCLNRDWHQRGIEACDEGLKLIDDHPKNRFQVQTKIRLLSLRARSIFLSAGDPDIAERDLRNAIQIGVAASETYPDFGPLYMAVGRSHFFHAQQLLEQGDAANAIESFNTAIDQFEECHRRQNLRNSPKAMAIHSAKTLADIALDDGKTKHAIDAWDRLVLLRPEKPIFYLAAFDYLSRVIGNKDLDSEDSQALRQSALRFLDSAVTHGHAESDLFRQEEHYQIWSESAEFQQIIRRMKSNR